MTFDLVVQETSKELEQHCQKNGVLSVRAYAVRFLKCDKPDVFHSQAEVPLTPDRISDPGILDLSWEDSLTEVWIIAQPLYIFVSVSFLSPCTYTYLLNLFHDAISLPCLLIYCVAQFRRTFSTQYLLEPWRLTEWQLNLMWLSMR